MHTEWKGCQWNKLNVHQSVLVFVHVCYIQTLFFKGHVKFSLISNMSQSKKFLEIQKNKRANCLILSTSETNCHFALQESGRDTKCYKCSLSHSVTLNWWYAKNIFLNKLELMHLHQNIPIVTEPVFKFLT